MNALDDKNIRTVFRDKEFKILRGDVFKWTSKELSDMC